jgi:hypothetical protein
MLRKVDEELASVSCCLRSLFFAAIPYVCDFRMMRCEVVVPSIVREVVEEEEQEREQEQEELARLVQAVANGP